MHGATAIGDPCLNVHIAVYYSCHERKKIDKKVIKCIEYDS